MFNPALGGVKATQYTCNDIVVTVVVYNVEQEVVASRTILIVKGQHCMCVWYCECVCYGYPHPGPLPCKPITIKEYNKAGFPGQLPVTTSVACSILFNVLLGVLWLILFLLLFGKILPKTFCKYHSQLVFQFIYSLLKNKGQRETKVWIYWLIFNLY